MRGKKVNQQLINKEMNPLTASSPSQYQEYPINDIQSDNKSTNQDLCESFEGLMKKQELDYSTRNTQWSEKEKEIAAASNFEHNQKGIGQISHLAAGFNLHKVQSKSYIQSQIKKKQSEKKIASLKNSIFEQRNQKIKRLRDLLPYFYSVDIPVQLKNILKVSEKIDKYLVSKKAGQYMDNVQNIFKTVFEQEEMSQIWSALKKVMFLAEEFYKIRVDPLKNLCIGFGSKKDIKLYIRKQRLRKIAVDYYLAHKSHFKTSDIPQAYVQPTKMIKFYPQNLNIVQKSSFIKKANPQFVDSLKKSVNQKQEQIACFSSPIKSAEAQIKEYCDVPSYEQLSSFCELICQVYSQKLVTHMYKVSLIQSLRQYQNFTFEKILFLLKYIINEGIFLEVLIKSGCQILRIVQKQREKLLQVLQLKIKAQQL